MWRALLILLASGASFPPEAGSAPSCPPDAVCGVVVDTTGRPLELVEVAIAGENGVHETVTDADGRFVITSKDVDPERAVFHLRLIGAEVVTVPYAQAARTGFRLVYAKESRNLDEIVVTSRRISTAFAPRRIPQLEILSNPMARADPLLAVSTLPAAANTTNSADLQLRGSDIGLARVYFNDIPLYELVRGSTIDTVTRGSSVLNPTIVHDAEVYPSNPPAFLANNGGAALRILPGSLDPDTTSLFAALTGVGATLSRILGDGRSVDAYASYTDLAPLLAVNPSQKRITEEFRSQSLGANWYLETADGPRLDLLTMLDHERGEFPLAILNLDGPSTTERYRLYLAGSLELPREHFRLKIDSAFSRIETKFSFLGESQKTPHTYLYENLDVSGPLVGDLLHYRAGLTFERFVLKTSGTTPLVPPDAPGTPTTRDDYVAGFAYLTASLGRDLSVAAGTRQFLTGLDLKPSYNGTLRYRFFGGSHSVIVGGGTYSAAIPDGPGTASRLAAARTRQISLDYVFEGRAIRISAGVFAKRDAVDLVPTRVRGFDVLGELSPTGWLTLKLAFSRFRTRTRVGADSQPRGRNDLPYLVRATAAILLGKETTLNIGYVARSGAVFTPVVDARAIEGSDRRFLPIFAFPPNGARLRPYRSLDLNLVTTPHFLPVKHVPIIFLSVTNLLDRKNPARIVHSADFRESRPIFFNGRLFTFGLAYNF